jgi:predicted PurR-regulated permease PerM
VAIFKRTAPAHGVHEGDVHEADRSAGLRDGPGGETRTGGRRGARRAPEPLRHPREGEDGAAAPERTGDQAPSPDWKRPLLDRPVVRSGIYAWALVGIIAVTLAGLYVLDLLRLVVVPLVLALFPAAILVPVANRLKRWLPDSLAALLSILGFLLLLGGVIAALAPSVANELDGLVQQAQAGAEEFQRFLEEGPLGFQPIRVDELLQQAQDRLTSGGADIGTTVLGYASAVVEGVAGLLLGLVILFFYLKDGARMGAWVRNLFPRPVRGDVDHIGSESWETVGGYIRGQLLIALVDAVLIGLGILLLGVPLALPLAVLVFFGGLFPIVGAVISGLVAVLVALATNGVTTALFLLAIIVAVQQLEGDVLAPIVFGRTVQLHPLAVLAALTAGGVLLGVLGAFLAVPVAASATRAAGYLRERIPG